MELNTFISRLFSAAEAAGIAPAEAACSQSDSFRVRVRRGELEDYQVSENAGLTLRGRVNGRIGTASTQALTEESIPLLIQGVLESAALIETDEQDDILPPDNSYASVCNDSEAVTALTAEQKICAATIRASRRIPAPSPQARRPSPSRTRWGWISPTTAT